MNEWRPRPNHIEEVIINEIRSYSENLYDHLREITYLPIEDLIRPRVSIRTKRIPRPQNSFVIFRRDINAKSKTLDGKSHLRNISIVASGEWAHASQTKKQAYALLATMAKNVHDKIFPAYRYHPRHMCIRANLPDKNSQNAVETTGMQDARKFCQPRPEPPTMRSWSKFSDPSRNLPPICGGHDCSIRYYPRDNYDNNQLIRLGLP